MLNHYLLICYRNFIRSKTTFFINLIGLSTGLTCAFLIYLWVTDELNFDKFHEKDGRLFQIMTNDHNPEGIKTREGTGGLLSEALSKELPEIEYATSMTPPAWFQKFTISFENKNVGATGNFVGKDYFNVFTYQLLDGDNNKVLADKNSIVISERLALSLFNTTENLIGKALEWKWLYLKKSCVISGVYKDSPSNSTYQFDFVVSFEVWKDIVPETSDIGFGPFNTFVVLKEGSDFERFNNKITNFVKDKFPDINSTLFARQFSKGYLYGRYENGVQSGGRIEYVKLFSIIAIFIVLIACINFMNLSTAKATRRIKEIGIKKSIGAKKNSITFQFLLEAAIISFLSLVVGLLLVIILLPQFNIVTGKHLALELDGKAFTVIVGITLLTALVAGSYPALYLSRFSPATVLRGNPSSGVGESWARKTLVIFQFIVSVVFIVSVLVAYKQIEFIQAKNLGYDKENIIYFEMEGKVAENPETFLSEIKKIPGILSASSIQQKPILNSFLPAPGIEWEGKNQDSKIKFFLMGVNYEMIETLNIKLKEGRTFSRDFSSDSTAVILNEMAIKTMELNNPVGKYIKLWGAQSQIIGVVKDFHFQSLHEEVKPFLFRLMPRQTMLIMAKIDADGKRETINALQHFYVNFNPGFSFDYKFLDDDYQAQYAGEKRVAILSRYFAGLAIIISCLGLFGLATFTAERRLKEIGVRKVLGSSEWNIVYLLSVDFTKIVLISIVIALPLSYWISKKWLSNFAYNITLDAWYFVTAGVLALVIAWLTVAVQTIKASRVNPVVCLKTD
jgi:putative ABC transport system permease protein